MAVIDVGGVQGVGKTTLIEHTRLNTPEGFKVIKRSRILAELLECQQGMESRIDLERFMTAREKMRSIVSLEDDCVRDVHFSQHAPKQEIFPVEDSDRGRVSAVILVQSSLEAIISRRKQGDRPRSIDPAVVMQQVTLEAVAAQYVAHELEVPLITIDNIELDMASESLQKIIRTYI